MRPDGTPHLYETPMVPNLLPFSAAVTTGGGPTPTNVMGPVAEPGFATMLAPLATPMSQEPLGKGIAVLPLATLRLVGLTDAGVIEPAEVALPETLAVTDPLAVPVMPVIDPKPVVPEPAPVAESTGETPVPPAPIAKATTPGPSPEGGSVTVVDGPDKAALAVVPPAPDAASVPELPQTPIMDAPTAPTAIAKPAPTPMAQPAPPPVGVGGTVTTVDRPDKAALPVPPTGTDAPLTPLAKPAEPAPVVGPQGGTVTIVEPVRKSAIPTPVQPKAIPTPEDGSVTVIDGPRKPIINPVPEAAVETAPLAIEPVAVAPTADAPSAVEPDPVTAAPVEDGTTPPEAPTDQNPAEAQAPAMTAVHTTPIAPIIVEPATSAPAPATVEAQTAAAAPVALRVVEPAPADIANDAPADDGAFDTLVTAKSDAETDVLRTTSDTGGDAMNRDGNRQPTPQPAAPAPAAAQAAATPLPAFDPLAAAAPQGATHTGDPAATEHRARASALGEDVGIAIVRHADSGSGEVLVIRLDPAELGKIEVRLRMDEARQLSAEVTADQPATLDLLRRDSDNLTRALNDAGFRADDQSLRFDSRGFGQSDQQAQQGRRIASRAYLNDGDAANAQSTPTPVQVRSSGRVDLVA